MPVPSDRQSFAREQAARQSVDSRLTAQLQSIRSGLSPKASVEMK
jgi:hypothetical protein